MKSGRDFLFGTHICNVFCSKYMNIDFLLGSRSPRMVLIIAPILEDADQSEWILKWCNVFYFHIWLKRHNGGLDLLLPNKYIQTGYIIDKLWSNIFFTAWSLLAEDKCLKQYTDEIQIILNYLKTGETEQNGQRLHLSWWRSGRWTSSPQMSRCRNRMGLSIHISIIIMVVLW